MWAHERIRAPAGGQAAFFGLAQGLVTGPAQGFREARQNQVNPWSGADLRPYTEYLAPLQGAQMQELPVDINAPQGQQINWDKQIRHTPGKANGRSILHSNPDILLEGLQSGRYKVLRAIGSKYLVNFGHWIGTYYYQGDYVGPSSYGWVIFSKTGVHIYPASPNQN